MTDQSRLAELAQRLLPWYQRYARDLPWREDASPYRVWISEIMLQQTRIETVRGYFERFMAEFPDISSLAAAQEDRVLKLWEGLGYYSRARNLHRAAKICEEQYGGSFPDRYDEILALPGIGPYTAGAIGSIAFAIPVPAVDGNVLRVVTRILAEGGDITKAQVRKRLEMLLREVLPEEEPGTFNQALMELGERVCIPNGAPDCENCPAKDLCRAREQENPLAYPSPKEKKKRRIEPLTVLIFRRKDTWAIRRRGTHGLLAGMYEYPNLPGHLSSRDVKQYLEEQKISYEMVRQLPPARHIFSHVEWEMKAYEITLTEPQQGELLFVTAEDLRTTYSVPAAFRTYTNLIVNEGDRNEKTASDCQSECGEDADPHEDDGRAGYLHKSGILE